MLKNDTNIGDIIQECLDKPEIKKICLVETERKRDTRYLATKNANLSRVIGYCILFRSSEGIEDYMKLTDKIQQARFLRNKVIEELELDEITGSYCKEEIFNYIYKNFKENGYVFHAGNSKSIEKKMTYGLEGSISKIGHRNQLVDIDSIYKNYDIYEILGWGASDVEDYKFGWFYEGNPMSAMYYANSPEWFRYFCGQAEPYEKIIEEKNRFGYEERDYKMSLKAITTLMDNIKMEEEDRKKVLKFFEECWDKLKDTEPYLMLVPIKETVISIDSPQTFIDKYENGNINLAIKRVLEDVIKGSVAYSYNVCCDRSVEADKLSCVNLSKIMPRINSEENKSKERKGKDIQISENYKIKKVNIGNTGVMYYVKDGNNSKEYYFKPAESKSGEPRPYRAYIQEAAYEIQKIINPKNAVKCNVININDMFGAIQEKIDIDKEATEEFVYNFYNKVEKFSPKIINQIMDEYLVDFCLCNYDSHSRNFVIDKKGNLRGIDKEQSFRYIMNDYKNDMMFSNNYNIYYGEQPPIYNTIFNKIKEGKMSVEYLKRLTDTAKKINEVPDEQYREIFKKYAYGKTFTEAEAEKLLDQIVTRKTNIIQNVRNLQKEIYIEWYKNNQKATQPSISDNLVVKKSDEKER